MSEFLTSEPNVRRLLEVAGRAARSQANILLTGESGTGKNRLARFIHAHSRRSAGPFVEVACANLPEELLESLLFGHERGAFTGAHEQRCGRFELADGGTLYLDEVQELQPELQAKVLRVLAEKRFERVGGSQTLEVDTRIVASTCEDPERLVADRRLREDLYYRLNVVRLSLLPLRERRRDIRLLAEEFLKQAVVAHGLPPRRLSPGALERLEHYPWPGNIRELQHSIESACVLASAEEIGVEDLPKELSVASPSMVRAAAAEGLSLGELEAAYIDEVLRRTGGNKSAAARILGIHRKTLHEKLRSRS